MALDDIDNDDETENEESKGGGGMVKILLIVNAVIILIAITVGITWFLVADDEDASRADTEVLEELETVEEAPAPSGGSPIYVPLNPAFVVNFENQDQVSFLQVDIQVMTYDTAVQEALKRHMPIVRNELLLLLGGKQYHEINTREGKRALAQEAINEIRRVLESVGAPSEVEAVYFTSFVMQ